MSLYWLDEVYFFVQDNHHPVSVAHFRGTEWMDAKVTEFRSTVCGIPLRRVKSASVRHPRARILPRSGSGHRQHLVGAAQEFVRNSAPLDAVAEFSQSADHRVEVWGGGSP